MMRLWLMGGAAAIAVGVVIAAYHQGYRAGQDGCEVRTRAAIIAAQDERDQKNNAALQVAQDAAATRQSEIEKLQAEVDAYEARKDDSCTVGADDARRLQSIR